MTKKRDEWRFESNPGSDRWQARAHLVVKLTAMQRAILRAMAGDELGLAAFTGEKSRVLGFGAFKARDGGLVIRAYGTPAVFLEQRKLIERHDRNVPGAWYRITDAGRSGVA